MRFRYTIVIADPAGRGRRFTLDVRVALGLLLAVMVVPALVGLGAKWSARSELEEVRAANALLQEENNSYRVATGELAAQIQSLEGVINDLGAHARLDPEKARAMQKLPPIVKARAAGGAASNAAVANVFSTFASPEDTFGILRDLLSGLESRLLNVRQAVERREALANATPSLWPAHGWLTGMFGGRSDPFTGEEGFHQGIDISTEKGQPVYATADGRVETAAYAGDYGNLIVIKHGFGLATRYAHLSGFAVKAGEAVRRGQIIGYVGATGRATGAHLHYEILANGQLLNPLQLLARPAER